MLLKPIPTFTDHTDLKTAAEPLPINARSHPGCPSLDLFGGTRDRRDYSNAVENFIGTIQVPVGLTAPLAIRGRFADDNYRIPLATTEASLVASYSRGAKAISEAGGCTSMLLDEAIDRAPGFVFKTLPEAVRFADWATARLDEFGQIAQSTTRHGRLVGLDATVEGNHVYLNLSYVTGEAAGQNMITIATEAVLAYISEHAPVRPERAFVEANHSGDKKPDMRSMASVRGKRVSAEVVLPASIVMGRLRAEPEQMVEFWRLCVVGGALSGAVGMQGHFANGLAALYIACGQDAACVAESAVGVTRFEMAPEGGLYAAVTLPNIVVGTVGGGTGLPGQRACLDIMGLSGSDSARAFAEICAALCLAGDLSIAAALSAGHFTRAHHLMARRRARKAGGRQHD
jgi:hydroxymethylglutaryl-CoA reductase (NADPH)